MIKELQLRILPRQALDEESIIACLAVETGLAPGAIRHVRVLRRSVDARHGTAYVDLRVRVYVDEDPLDEPFRRIEYRDASEGRQVTIVGAGPAGLFAALRLIELGLRPVVIERGKDVRGRKRDIARISRMHEVDAESNYCFGEGGAGAFSDGKLYTRSRKRGDVGKVLGVLCQHGAPLSILSDAHPHIGTDRLPRVIENMRGTILGCGGEIRFSTRMDSLVLRGDDVVGIRATDLESGGEVEFPGPVILATGHSARDVYRHLHSAGTEMEAKGIAVGVRLEHPSGLIDRIQYHDRRGRGDWLPAAEYSFVTQVRGRGVYSFCMCPGGFVIPAATGPGQVVVNGMSPSGRDSRWSNSGMVVELRPEDVPGGGGDALSVMRFQEEIERQAWEEGGMRQSAPAQRMVDFTRAHLGADLPRSSYAPGLVPSRLDAWLPKGISSRLREGFVRFGRMSPGFLTNEAVLIAAETRTSSPVRILRDGRSLCHVRLGGLFPCGEGAGYAGGIVSAAIDGERCAQAAMECVRGA